MPKRVPTPQPGDDEPRYLSVVYPYAISGTCNMELPKDRQDFARWVASCIDKDAFFAIFHKPSARAMVIIEISRDYAHFDRILGEHRWGEFLQTPSKEERARSTQVFYCTYNTGRIVQKNGWKRIDVEEAWFKAWSPRNRHIKSPYPPTHFCDVPIEDQTNHSLCRPLPGAVTTVTPVIAAPQPVVGSAAWTQEKDGRAPPAPAGTQTKPNPLGAWGKGAPKSQTIPAKPNPTANGSVKKPFGIPQASHTPTGQRLPAVGGGSVTVKANNVWQNANKRQASTPVAASWDESPPVSRQGTPVLPVVATATATATATAHQASAAPSDLPVRKSAWDEGATSYSAHPSGLPAPSKIATSVGQSGPDRAANLSAASWDSTGASTSSPDSDSGPDLTTATESDNPYFVQINFSGSMEEEFHGMGIRAIEDDEDLRELDAIAPGAWDEPTAGATWDTTEVPGWDNVPADAEDQWKQNQETAKPILCNAHGIICKKGICAEYGKQLRLQKRAKEAEERRAAAANRGKKGGRGKGRGLGKKNEENEPTDRNKAQAPNSQFRGPGAPVRTNWRGAPRAIISADTIEKRETTKDTSDDGWDNSGSEVEPNVAAVAPAGAGDAASNGNWDVSPARPDAKVKGSSGKPDGKKKPAQTRSSSNWAHQVEKELAGGGDASGDNFSVVASKRGSKRGSSSTNWGTSAAKSSTSGWGSVPDMPW